MHLLKLSTTKKKEYTNTTMADDFSALTGLKLNCNNLIFMKSSYLISKGIYHMVYTLHHTHRRIYLMSAFPHPAVEIFNHAEHWKLQTMKM